MANNIANVGAGGSATTLTTSMTSTQAPAGSLVIASVMTDEGGTTGNTNFTNNNSGWTKLDDAGPTGIGVNVYARVLATAGVSVSFPGASGADRIILLSSFSDHNGIPTPGNNNGKVHHTDTGNFRTSATNPTTVGGSIVANNFSGARMIVHAFTTYASDRSVTLTGCSIISGAPNPTTGTTTTTSTTINDLEGFFLQDTTIDPGVSVGGRTPSYTGTYSAGTHPFAVMAILVDDVGQINLDATDSTSLSDTANISATNTGSDSVSFTDNAALNASQNVTDQAILTDTASVEQFAVPKSATDTFTLTENAVILQLLYANGVDEATQLDAATIAASMLVSDTLTLSDASSITASTPTTDSATQIDAASINVITTDTATQTEQTVLINQEFTDSATQSEGTVKINVAKSDSATLSESVITNHPTTDTAKLSESVVIAGMQMDSATLSESATVFVTLPVEDELDLYDEIKRLRTEPLPTEDPFPSKEPAYTRKRSPFRVIAQDIFTKRFVHLDVPILGDPTLTYTLSGPNLFQGVLNWEAPSLQNLEFPLEPYRTWLHVEEDYEIRMSTILQPFIDDNKSRQRVMEGVGFSWYPKEIYYQGEEYKGIQVDPASVIRLIWNHIQSYQNGNLGVVVSSTSTPVRIGTAPKNVEFETGAGESVAFEAGPYNLNWWEVKNLGSEIDKLMKETPIESYENSNWNRDRSDITHRLELGYPRVGTKQTEIYFQEGMNLTQIIPKRNENKDVWKSDIIIVGAGEGAKAVRAYASENTGRLRRTEVLENQDITDIKRAQAIADFEKQRRRRSRYSIDAIEINAAHSNAPWGSFIAGDDILVEGTVIYDGRIQDWHRITSYTYKPKAKRAVLSLSPSESFTYGQISEVD